MPGVAVPFDTERGGWARITTPCESHGWVPLDAPGRIPEADVVLDPGHGGAEPGAVGPGKLSEKELNLDVVNRAAAELGRHGLRVALTRNGDYRATLSFRVALAAALRPRAFVSVHHNSDPDGPMEHPGTETYYQYRSPESKRLAGLVYEEVFAALKGFDAQWVGDRDAGAKWRLGSGGRDYYGILRRSGEAGVVTALAELSFLSNPSEEALLRRDDVRKVEAGALASGILRFLTTSDPGSGFVTPYPRTQPAGPGGGRSGCADPLMDR